MKRFNEEFNDWWDSFYGSATPIAYILRDEIPNRWMRIHSLPESKRYPETTEEYEILLARHNTVATEVLGLQRQCVLISGSYTENPEEAAPLDFSQIEALPFRYFRSVSIYEPEDFMIWFAPVTWETGCFDEIIKVVAEDRVRLVMFASLETGEAYAPYDGGADLFLNSVERRDE